MTQIKNLPHQQVAVGKLLQALFAMGELNSAGADVRDDGVLGSELARRRIHEFVGIDYTQESEVVSALVEERLAVEARKRTSDQGARTKARDTRRLMRMLGFIDPAGRLTEAGKALVSVSTHPRERAEILRQALVGLTVANAEGQVSSPMRILLRLVGEVDFTSRDGMEAALAAQDDSEEEYQRVKALSTRDQATRMNVFEATEAQMANAIKVLPALAERAGLMGLQDGTWVLTEDGARLMEALGVAPEAAEPIEVDAAPVARRPRVPIEFGGDVPEDEGAGGDVNALTAEQQQEAARRLLDRSRRHERLVSAVATALEEMVDAEFAYHPSSYDLVAVPADAAVPVLLWEAKTIDGDAAKQSRAAIGQLAFYETFDVRPNWPDREVARIAAFDNAIGDELASFLDAEGVAAFVCSDQGLVPLNELAEELVRLIEATGQQGLG